MNMAEFQNICTELAEFYSTLPYSPALMKRLFGEFRFCETHEIKNCVESMTNNELRMPSPAVFRLYCRPAAIDAARRRQREIEKKSGVCGYCLGSGMVVVVEHKDPHKTEKTMRCGECQMADALGVLRHVQPYTDMKSKGIEPVILSKSLTRTPTKGRLDEIRALPADQLAELLQREPWLKWPLKIYGSKKIGKPALRVVGDSEEWEANYEQASNQRADFGHDDDRF